MAKLVDILARELKVWPCLGRKLCQGHKGHIYLTDGGDTYAIAELAEDWELADVMRDEWQAAVDALKAGAEPTWIVPPVGDQLEWRYGDMEWKIGEALYIGSVYAILKSPHGDEQHYYLRDMQFRPARTAEQIATEERKESISKMLRYAAITGESYRDVCGKLYDAGYRKLEPGEES